MIDIKIKLQFTVGILLLIKIYLHENVGRVGVDSHLHRVHILVLNDYGRRTDSFR